MRDELNENVFEAILKKAFCDYNENFLSSYPDCETLSKMYPLSKKEKRFFDRTAKEAKYGKSLVRVYLSRAAVVFLCFVTLAVAVMMTSPTVRASVKNVIMQWFEKYTTFTFVSTDSGKKDFESVEDVKIGYIPDGYELAIEDKSPKDFTYIYYFGESDLVIEVFENEAIKSQLDNERYIYTKMKINGNEAWITYDEVNASGAIVIVDSKITIEIYANLPKEELIQIAENIE